MSDLDKIINTIIPILLIVIAVGFVYWKFGEPLKKLWGLIRGLFDSGKGRAVETYRGTREIIYEPG
jgi:hypothetical protein